MANFCSKCGVEAADGRKYCGKCGGLMERSDASAPSSALESLLSTQAAPKLQSANARVNGEDSSGDSAKRKRIVAVGTVFLLVSASVAGGVMYAKKNGMQLPVVLGGGGQSATVQTVGTNGNTASGAILAKPVQGKPALAVPAPQQNRKSEIHEVTKVPETQTERHSTVPQGTLRIMEDPTVHEGLKKEGRE